MTDVFVNSIKEIIVEDEGLSWKYVIINKDDEGTYISYWEINLETEQWEKKSEFRIDMFCNKQVFEAALSLITENNT